MNKYKSLLVNIGIFAITTVATKLTTFLLVPLYTYYLTTSEYGISDMSTLVVGIVAPIGTFAIGDAVLRFMIDDKDQAADIASIGIAVTCFSCIIVLLLLPLLDLPAFGGLGEYRWLFLLSYIAYSFQDLFGRIARGNNQLKIITIASVASSLCTAGCAVIFIAFLKQGLLGFFYSYICGLTIGSLIFLIVGKHYMYIQLISWNTVVQLLRKMTPYAIPLIPNNVLWLFNTSINRLFITSMIGIAASGLFAASYKIPNLLNTLYSVFFQAWTLSSFQEYRKTDVNRFFSVVLTLLNALLVVAGSLIILLSPWLASWFLQKEFYEGWIYMPILILALYFNSLASFWGSIYTMVMKTKYILVSTIVSAIVCMISTWFLIPYIGLFGAAIGMVLSNLVLLGIRMLFARRFIRIHILTCSTITSAVFLILQAVLMTLRPQLYNLVAVLAMIICIVQIISVLRVFKQFQVSKWWKRSHVL